MKVKFRDLKMRQFLSEYIKYTYVLLTYIYKLFGQTVFRNVEIFTYNGNAISSVVYLQVHIMYLHTYSLTYSIICKGSPPLMRFLYPEQRHLCICPEEFVWSKSTSKKNF